MMWMVDAFINNIEEMGAMISKEAIGEKAIGEEIAGEEVISEEVIGKEVMVDTPKELVPEEGAMSPIIEGAIPSGVMGVDDALTTQVPSIDTLLGDIYELKYLLA